MPRDLTLQGGAAKLRERLPDAAIISIAHRPGIADYHAKTFELAPNGLGSKLATSASKRDPVTPAEDAAVRLGLDDMEAGDVVPVEAVVRELRGHPRRA